MADENWKVDPHGQSESLDADAVCAQCSEVNPAGTLICRVCGNNLRDQRRQRMLAEEQLMVGDEPVTQAVRWLPGVLALLGLLLITYTALNVDRIADWLVDTRGASDSSDLLWSGSDAAEYDAMTANLRDVVLTSQQIYSAQSTVSDQVSNSGTYVVLTADQDYAGRVEVVETDAGARFVAILENGADLRGEAVLSGRGTYTVDWLHGGGVFRAGRFAFHGVATRQGNGHFEGFGESTLSDEVIGFEIFCLPE